MQVPGFTFFEDGAVKMQVEEKGNEYIIKEFYPSGKLFVERIRANGYYKEFHENGTLAVEANYENYLLVGDWKAYSEDGSLQWVVGYENDYRHGAYKKYYPNGNVEIEGINVKDKKNGEEKRYDENGHLVWKGNYKNNKFVKTWFRFDATGKVSKKYKSKDLEKNADLNVTEVPDGVLERMPIYKGCEDYFGNKELKKCMSRKISQFIVENINLKVPPDSGLYPGTRQRVSVAFLIDKEGNVKNVQIKGPHPMVDQEVMRVIYLVPRLKPGTIRGKAVDVPYALPILINTPAR